ncbi:hypothetical protein SUS17_188 [Sphingomonas sp. S17]|nr:hypothetical protein SUS17_188 [Sphingomonas sp. S17]
MNIEQSPSPCSFLDALCSRSHSVRQGDGGRKTGERPA